jgi:hypothetical protein
VYSTQKKNRYTWSAKNKAEAGTSVRLRSYDQPFPPGEYRQTSRTPLPPSAMSDSPVTRSVRSPAWAARRARHHPTSQLRNPLRATQLICAGVCRPVCCASPAPHIPFMYPAWAPQAVVRMPHSIEHPMSPGCRASPAPHIPVCYPAWVPLTVVRMPDYTIAPTVVQAQHPTSRFVTPPGSHKRLYVCPATLTPACWLRGDVREVMGQVIFLPRAGCVAVSQAGKRWSSC